MKAARLNSTIEGAPPMKECSGEHSNAHDKFQGACKGSVRGKQTGQHNSIIGNSQAAS
jgi:hypothetical protein